MPQCQFLFSAFLYFRKVLHEIFSELHWTKTQCLIIPSRSHSQKGRRSGATGWPDTRPGRSPGWPCRACVGPPWPPPTPPLCLFILLREKTLGEQKRIHEKSRRR